MIAAGRFDWKLTTATVTKTWVKGINVENFKCHLLENTIGVWAYIIIIIIIILIIEMWSYIIIIIIIILIIEMWAYIIIIIIIILIIEMWAYIIIIIILKWAYIRIIWWFDI